MIHVYYGDGKGKTTSAVGLAARAAGSNLKVLFVQFLKTEFSGVKMVAMHLVRVDDLHLGRHQLQRCVCPRRRRSAQGPGLTWSGRGIF